MIFGALSTSTLTVVLMVVVYVTPSFVLAVMFPSISMGYFLFGVAFTSMSTLFTVMVTLSFGFTTPMFTLAVLGFSTRSSGNVIFRLPLVMVMLPLFSKTMFNVTPWLPG